MASMWTDRVSQLTADCESITGDTKLFTLKAAEYGGDVFAMQTLCESPETAQRKMKSYKHQNIVETLTYTQEPAPQGKLYVYVIMRGCPNNLQRWTPVECG